MHILKLFCVGWALGGTSALAAAGFGSPVNVGTPINTSYGETGGALSPDGSMIVFASNRPGGLGGLDLWMSHWMGSAWSEPVNLGSSVNSGAEERNATLSSDGKALYFRSNRSGGVGGFDLYQSEQTDAAWGPAELMPGSINTEWNEWGGGITPDGSRFYFGAERSGYLGRAKVHYSEWGGSEWGEAVLVNELDSPYHMGHCSFGASDTEMLMTWENPAGQGGYDNWITTRQGGVWQAPVNLGPDVNSSSTDWEPNLSPDGSKLFFTSTRLGGLGGSDIWMAVRGEDGGEPYPVGDLNCDRRVNVLDIVTLIHHVFRHRPLEPCGPCSCP